MSNAAHKDPLDGDPRSPARPSGDRDVALGRIVGFLAGLALLVVAAAAVCALIYGALRASLARSDPPPSPIPEANDLPAPPEPRLQESPPKDMAALRAREGAILEGYGWVDKDAGIVRIPIERAIDLTLAPGLRPASAARDAGAGGGGVGGGAP